MATFDASARGPGRSLPRGSLEWSRRAPWRRGFYSPEEAAAALHARRAELYRSARTRADARDVPESTLEELVDEAVATVVMMRRPIVSDEHLLGAFWKTVGILLRHRREGRHRLRIGARKRADFDLVARRVWAEEPGPAEVIELKERVSLAADFAAQLTALERRVVALMARRGVGAKHAARALSVPLGEVRAAARSADAKLDRVAMIAAAGRLCDYRQDAIASYAAGSCTPEDEQRAQTHLAACTACRKAYAPLIRELRGTEFQRRLSAAFLPIPALPVAHSLGAVGRALGWIGDQLPFGGPGERVAEVLGGAGIVKVAAAGGAAVVLATATISAGVHSLEPSRHRRAQAGHRRSVTTHRASGRPAHGATVAAQGHAIRSQQTSASTARGATSLTPTQRVYREFSLPISTPTASVHHRARSKPSANARAAALPTSEAEGPSTRVSPASRRSASAATETSAAEREFGGP